MKAVRSLFIREMLRIMERSNCSIWCCLAVTIFLIQEFWVTEAAVTSLIKKNSNDFENTSAERSVTIGCSEGWDALGGKCYRLFGLEKDKLNWDTAKQKCSEMGASMVSIHSKEEQEFLTQMITREGRHHTWIGLHEVVGGPSPTDRIFRWSDASPLDFTQWQEGEPNNYLNSKEECVHMRFTENHHGSWNDLPCNILSSYACQIPREVPSGTDDEVNGIIICSSKRGCMLLTSGESILCGENTCKNEGTCTQDGINGYFKCWCKYGYRGQTCEEVDNEVPSVEFT